MWKEEKGDNSVSNSLFVTEKSVAAGIISVKQVVVHVHVRNSRSVINRFSALCVCSAFIPNTIIITSDSTTQAQNIFVYKTGKHKIAHARVQLPIVQRSFALHDACLSLVW